MSEHRYQGDIYQGDMAAPARSRGPLPRNEAPIVPPGSLGGRALVAVVAIMTFLTSLTTGAVLLVRASAGDWQAEISREVTIQVRPASGRVLDDEVQKAAELARTSAGIAQVRVFSREESARLLEPWLGSGLSLEDLPVPRVVVLKLSPDQTADLTSLRRRLTERVPGATLDDHRGWVERMRAMASSAVIGGVGIVILVLAATVLSVTFATRGAMAANMPVIEVLHFIGARDSFIARQFQRHFLALGLKGGLIGGVAAIVLFVIAGFGGRWILGSAAADQASTLFGSFSIGIDGYLVLVLQIFLVAGVTAAASRHAVYRTLADI
jgi:cell division transport system permease protein